MRKICAVMQHPAFDPRAFVTLAPTPFGKSWEGQPEAAADRITQAG